MKTRIILTLLATMFFGCMPYLASVAHAEDCSNLDANAKWKTGLQELIALYEQGQYEDARTLAIELNGMCSKSPILNYMNAKIAEGLNDDETALKYFQEASKNTYDIAVPPDTAKKIWYARYEKEHPERTANSVETLKTESESLAEQTEQLKEQTRALSTKILKTQQSAEIETLRNDAARSMWIGTGIGAMGLAVTAAGIALTVTSEKYNYEYQYTGSEPDDPAGYYESNRKDYGTYKVNPRYEAGLALLGVGLAMTITGAIFAGIYGYQYTHIGNHEDLFDTIDFAIAPNGVSMHMFF